MADQLVDFIRSRKQQESSAEIDWQAKKEAWVRSVDSLYNQIRGMLGDSIDPKDVREFEVQVTEDFIGTYAIRAFELRIGSERVEFRPKGVTVIGAAGRVDIRGERDTVTLIKEKLDGSSEWTIVLQRVPSLTTVRLDRDSLKDALERVMLPLS